MQRCSIGEILGYQLAVLIDNGEHCFVHRLLICVSDTFGCSKCVIHAPESALHCTHVAVSPIDAGPHGFQPYHAQPLPAWLEACADLQVLAGICSLTVSSLAVLQESWYETLLAWVLTLQV